MNFFKSLLDRRVLFFMFYVSNLSFWGLVAERLSEHNQYAGPCFMVFGLVMLYGAYDFAKGHKLHYGK